MAIKKCKSCLIDLPIERFTYVRNAARNTCKDCRNKATRKARASGAYTMDAEKLMARQIKDNARRKASKWWLEPKERAKRIAAHNARRRLMGIATRRYVDYWQINARQAWKYWMAVLAPDQWIEEYWASAGKPWCNARLSKAEKFKIRYALDAEFNARQRDKAQRINPLRKARVERLSDGTITPQFLLSLFAAANDCPYCFVSMGSYDKSLDHIEPLDPGLHSASNVLVCCKSCNTRKRRMPVDEFMRRCNERRQAA